MGANGSLTPLPGCPAVVVSHDVYVTEQNRGKGVGTAANSVRTEIAHELGYDVILCTVRADNEPQKKLLKKNNWNRVHSFQSSRNQAWLEIWLRNTNPYE